ncbi:hypothetical protein [Actinomyces slackii]|nr:hypothetical protein [Actinomyces slackii]
MTDETTAPASGAEVARALRDSGALDELFERIEDGSVALEGL